MDEYYGGYVVSFNSKEDVRILDYNKILQLEEKELRLLQLTSLNGMIMRMYSLMRPYWREEFIKIIGSIDYMMQQGQFDLFSVDKPEEVREYKKGFAYRVVLDEDKILKSNNEPWGFGFLGKNIEEYSMLACAYVVCYLLLSHNKSSYHSALNNMLSNIQRYLLSNYIDVNTEATKSYKLAKKYFS